MINFSQNTNTDTNNSYTLLNLALSEGWLACAYSNVDRSQYSFSIAEVTDQGNLQKSIEEAMSRYPNLRVRLALVDEEYTLLPNLLYRPEEEGEYLRHNSAISENHLTATDTVYSKEIKNIYGVSPDVLSAVPDLENVSVHHYLTPLLTYLPREGKSVFLVWSLDRCVVLASEAENITFVKSIKCNDTFEVLYHTLLAYQQSGFNRQSDPLYMMGCFE